MSAMWTLKNYHDKVYHPDFIYPWNSPAKTVDFYGDFYARWDRKKQTRQGENDIIRLFGDPRSSSFQASNIVAFDLSPYPSLNQSGRKTIGIHRGLIPAYRRIFEKLSEWGEYPIYGFGSSYDPRYALTDDKVPGYQNEEAACNPVPKTWMTANWKRLRDTTPGMELHILEEDWHWLPRRLYFYKQAHGGAEIKKMSNHSLGAALDVNPRTNGLASETWDMPKKVVEIFREEGFYWGGYYKSKPSLDAMHFEYVLKEMPRAVPILVFPFSGAAGDTPQRQYLANERGEGGLYPVGMSGNMHGGIHLRPAKAGAHPVKVSLPGYVVAARIFAKSYLAEHPEPHALAAGHLGLVVVRHKATSGTGPAKKTFTWHSLYLHLLHHDYGADLPGEWSSVPWFRKLSLSKHGIVINTDPGSPGFGRAYWSLKTFDPESAALEGIPFCGETALPAPPKEFLPAKTVDGRRSLIHKPAPDDLVEALQSLESGGLITFHKPFLQVAAGDVIGMVGPLDLPADQIGLMPPDSASRQPIQTGFLHWEWLSPTGSGGLDGLAEADERGKAGFALFAEQASDNYFEPEELSALLQKGVVEKSAISEAMLKQPYGPALRAFLKKQAGFADTAKNDLGPIAPAQPDTDDKPATYPLVLTFNNDLKLPPPDPGTTYSVQVEFLSRDELGARKLGEAKLAISDHTFARPLILQVPAEANALRLRSTQFHLLEMPLPVEQEAEQEWKLFQDMAKRRCRGIWLQHANEWTVAGVKNLLAKLKELKRVDAALAEDLFTPVAWYNRVRNAADPFSENPILGPENEEVSLFGPGEDQLPPDTAISNLHPVTALWLVTLLEKQGKLALEKEFASAPPPEDSQPFWWSAQHLPGTAGSGERMSLLAVAKGYPTDAPVTFELSQGGRTLSYPAMYQQGVALHPLKLIYWGAWKLGLKGVSGKPDPLQDACLEIQAEAPALLGPMRWTRDAKTGFITARVYFGQRCPHSLQAFIHMQESGGEAAAFVVPVEGRKRLGYDAARDPETSDFLVAKSKKICEYFSLAELAKACKGSTPARVNPGLAWAMDALREAWNAPLNLAAISPEGRAATFLCPNPDAAEKLAQLAGDLFGETAQGRVSEPKKVTLTVPDSGTTGGEWMATFDPADGFGKLLARSSAKATTAVAVALKFLCPNGADFSAYEVQEGGWNTRAFDFNAQTLESVYGRDVLQASSPKTQSLKPARFDAVRLRLQKLASRDGEPVYALKISQQLTGNKNDWVKAKPALTVDIPGLTLAAVKSVLGGGAVSVSVPFDEDWVLNKARLKTFAKVAANPVYFDGIKLNMPELELATPVAPNMVALPVEITGGFIRVRAGCNLIPPDRLFTASATVEGATPEESERLTKLLIYPNSAGGKSGKMNSESDFEVRLSEKAVPKGRNLIISFELSRDSGGVKEVFDILINSFVIEHMVT